MKYIIAALLSIVLAGCAGMSTAQQPVPLAAPPAAPVAKPPDSITINVPNWSMFLYQQGEAFLLLSVKEPANFPVPKEITFKNGDKVITMPMVKPSVEVPADKPK